jgi:hypothetical protein
MFGKKRRYVVEYVDQETADKQTDYLSDILGILESIDTEMQNQVAAFQTLCDILFRPTNAESQLKEIVTLLNTISANVANIPHE